MMESSNKGNVAFDANGNPLPIYRQDGRSLGILMRNVSAFGVAASSQTVSDLPSILFGLLSYPVDAVRGLIKGDVKTSIPQNIVEDVSTVLFPGETVLVLGRPGAGCSSVLKLMANRRDAFTDIQGMVEYAGIPAHEMSKFYKSEVVFNDEEDIHFSRLKVKDTLDFALRVRQPANDQRSSKQFSTLYADTILKSLGLLHTRDTIVGDAYVRGVSGGERKRVSLAEVLATNPALACWDNPIRGLDSSSALDFIRLIRDMSRETGMVNAVTLYQASDSMFELFDKVLVMYEGRMVYFGDSEKAKPYFQSLGFQCLPRQTNAEFLTGVTSPTSRVFKPVNQSVKEPTSDSLAKKFRTSTQYEQLHSDISQYQNLFCQNDMTRNTFKQASHHIRARCTLKRSNEPAAIWTQIFADLRRQYKLKWGERRILFTVVILTAVNAVITSSAYYHAPNTATGSYERSGAVFFSLIYFSLTAMTEVVKTVHSRKILLKQHNMGLIHPSAFVWAQTIAEMPIALLQSLVFACCYYFTVGLEQTASNFFIFVLIVFVHFGSVSCLFRLLGAWSPSPSIALLAAGSALPITCLYAGFAPTVPTMHRWGSWIRRISTTPWAMEALMGNEFAKISLQCTSTELVPHGPGYGNTSLEYQGCPMSGVDKGSDQVTGPVYLIKKYGYNYQNLWRNFGIIIAMWVIYVLLAALGLGIMTRETSTSSARVYAKKESRQGTNFQEMKNASTPMRERDIESQNSPAPSARHSTVSPRVSSSGSSVPTKATEGDNTTTEKSTFAFKDLNYYVDVAGEEKHLLQDVTAYVRPGQLTALMGASGAGKTTLLDTISQRKAEGRTEGNLRFGGLPLGPTFARTCGFCMQQDVHEPTATVREAFQFSALMRQKADIPKGQKLMYAEELLEALGLEPIADALVGSLGVEERKRVTIGVELATKPSALLFLDEPTSGLDSEAAHAIVSLLRKIAASGIPIVCTIHQPSSIIFEMFDHVLLLAPGGKTAYFGETGQDSSIISEYFARNGAPIAKDMNPAEFFISTIAVNGNDWSSRWQESQEKETLEKKVQALMETSNESMNTENPSNAKLEENRQFSLSLRSQTRVLIRRHWLAIWRNGPYNFSKLFKSCFVTLFISFTFFHVQSDAQGLQNHALALLLGSWIIPTVAADIQAIWFEKWEIFEARERNGFYDFRALMATIILVEIPWQIALFTLAFFCSYWTVGFANTPTLAGFVYFMYLLLSLFCNSFCYLMAALFPDETSAGYANSLFWVVLMMFSGVVVPHNSLNDFYRPWIFWVDPMRYFFGATIGTVLRGVEEVQCKVSDMALFDPPENQTCGEYLQEYITANPGSLINPNATSSCEFCPYSNGDEYAASMDFYFSDRWRDFAVFLGFCLTNLLLVFCITWVTRVFMRHLRK